MACRLSLPKGVLIYYQQNNLGKPIEIIFREINEEANFKMNGNY